MNGSRPASTFILLLLSLILLLTQVSAFALLQNRDIVISAYIYRIMGNIQWPDSNAIKQYNIHIIDTNKEVYNHQSFTTITTEHKDDADIIMNLIQKEQNADAQFVAHGLKGLSGNLSMNKLYNLTTQLEADLKNNKPKRVLLDNYGELEKILMDSIDFLQQKIPKENMQIKPSVDTLDWDSVTITPLANEFISSLESSNPEKAESNLNQLKLYLTYEQYASLSEMIDIYDMDEALLYFKSILQKNSLSA